MKNSLFIFLTVIILSNCAVQRSPEGGPKDTEPPKVIKCIPENRATNFSSTTIKLMMSEKIEIANLNEVIISPPIQNTKFLVKNDKILIKFPSLDSLNEIQTYTINFLNNIKDINEGNTLSGFKYVFSKSQNIDSNKIEGTVYDYIEKVPLENVYIYLLKENLSDGFNGKIKKENIVGLTVSEKNGKFNLYNISNDYNFILALDDKNKNQIVDNDERFDFVSSDKPNNHSEYIELNLFRNQEEIRLNDYYVKTKNKFYLKFTSPVILRNYKIFDSLFTREFQVICDNKLSDSFNCWICEQIDGLNKLNFVFEYDTKKDTIIIDQRKIRSKESINKKLISKIKPLINEIEIYFTKPIKEINDSLIKINAAGKIAEGYKIIFTNTDPEKLTISNLNNGTEYKIVLEKNSIIFCEDAIESTNVDIKTKNSEDFGLLKLLLQNPTNKNVILEIKNKQTKEKIKLANVSNDITISNINPGTYDIFYFIDENRNGKWDTGDLKSLKKPELFKIVKKDFNIKENWEYIEEINITN